MTTFVPTHLTWRPDVPDFRDWSVADLRIASLFGNLQEATNTDSAELPSEYFSHDVPSQNSENSSAACACVSVLQYFEYRSFGKVVEPSSAVLTHMSKRFSDSMCQSCTGIRATLKSIQKFGVPPEKIFDASLRLAPLAEIDPALFAFRDEYQSLVYVRLDAEFSQTRSTLGNVKSFLSAGIPVLFGFAVPSSLSYDESIDFRPTFDSIRGGQVAVLTGYDDRCLSSTRGALRIRCTWGTQWGVKGSGWLPYTFLHAGMARDFWVILKPEWLASGEFSRPSCVASPHRP